MVIKQLGFQDNEILCHHLSVAHKEPLSELSDEQLQEHGLLVCCQCGNFICTKQQDTCFETHFKTNGFKRKFQCGDSSFLRL